MSLFLSRRMLLAGVGAGSVVTLGRPALAQAVFDANPFQLGVAAGDPLPDGFVIWTRIAPRPIEPGYGMPRQAMRRGDPPSDEEVFPVVWRRAQA